MNKNLKNIFYFVGFVFLFLAGVASFNIYVDPMCYYRCDSIDLKRSTQNVYYQSAQIVAANQDAQILVVGSSRGETTPLLWIQQVTGQKTVNLSKGGAGLLLKVALLRTAEEYKLPLKKIIWIADYFELAGDVTDIKVRQTPVLRKQLNEELGSRSLKGNLERLQRLIDHNTFEASLQQLKHKEEDFFDPKGSGSQIDFQRCMAYEYKGKIAPELLPKAVDASYDVFSRGFLAPLNPHFLQIFKKTVSDFANKGVEVIIVVPPFHPDLMKRFYSKYPEAKQNFEKWKEYLNGLVSKNVQLLSYWEGIPLDNAGPSFWDDGAHPTCKSMMLMISPGIRH
ncbi:MAG: hypothetical protein ACXVCP_18135 [Bdellovibrio sp.]